MKHKTINGWTKAKMIERITTRMQDHRSVQGRSNVCVYRADDGNACAAGCFIPDHLYKNGLEGTSITFLMREKPPIQAAMPLGPEGMCSLQRIHDYGRDTFSIQERSLEGDPRPDLIKWIEDNVEDASV